MVILENLCVNCMKEKPIANGVCPHCGFDNTKYEVPEYQLPLYTKLGGDRYIIGKAIGSGGFGITYIGFDTRLNVPVAIKELFVSSKVRRDHGRTVLMNTTEGGIRQYEEIKRRFMQEARTMAELENIDGVVKVKDYFQQNDTGYIVMEYLDGKTLKETLQDQKKRMPLPEVMELLRPVMDSLEKMHKAGIVHRDISLDNIMLTKDGRVKLIDLGGEKRLGECDASDKTVAIKKSAYTPIEQILGKSSNIGPWTDVYALAVTIYRCICGRFPKGASERVNDRDIEKPSKLGVTISKKQEDILLKALSLDKKDRIQSVAQLQAGLTAEKKKRKLPLFIALFFVTLAGAAGGYFVWNQNQTIVIEGGTYVIANYENPDLVLEVPEAYYESGTGLALGTADNSNAQKFYIKEREKGSYYMSAVCSDHAITVDEEKGKTSGELVQREFSNELTAQQSWYFENAGKGTYYIRSGTEKYVFCHNDKVVEGSRVELSADNHLDSAKWVLISTRRNMEDIVTPVKGTIVKMADGIYQIIPMSNKEWSLTTQEDVWSVKTNTEATEQKYAVGSLDKDASSVTTVLKGQGLVQETAEQGWKCVFARRGSYYIQNMAGKMLTMNPEDKSVSLAEPVKDGEDDTYQRWFLTTTEIDGMDQLHIKLAQKGSFSIINRQNYDLCMVARGDSMQEGTTLLLAQNGNSQSQFFTIEEVEEDKYQIRNDYTGKYVTAVPDIDSSVRLMQESGDGGQIWSFEESENGYYYLKSQEGYYLGVDLDVNTTVFIDTETKEQLGFQWQLMKNE